jgi:hypothetical protein
VLGGAAASQDADAMSDIFDNDFDELHEQQLHHASSAEAQDEREPGQLGPEDDRPAAGAGAPGVVTGACSLRPALVRACCAVLGPAAPCACKALVA